MVTNAEQMTKKSSQFQGSRRKVKGWRMKPLANVFTTASTV